MFRKDIKHMLDIDWEPQIPSAETICRQAESFPHKTFGSVALHQGRVATHPIMQQSTNDKEVYHAI